MISALLVLIELSENPMCWDNLTATYGGVLNLWPLPSILSIVSLLGSTVSRLGLALSMIDSLLGICCFVR